MTQSSQRVHLADLANHIGWTYDQPNPDRSVTPMTVSGVEHSGLHMVVGLDQVRVTMPRSRIVRLSSAKDKVAHRHCGMRCRGLGDHATTDVAAGDLGSHIGRLAFIDGGAGPGPHLVLSLSVDGDVVHVSLSSTELVAPVDRVIEVKAPNGASRS